jgi:hypothetical protein
MTGLAIDVERYLAFLTAELPKLAKMALYPERWPFGMRRFAVLDAALDRFARGPGIGLEFGTYKGNSLRRMARRFRNRKFHGFDSFQGLPADGRLDWNLDFSTVGPPILPANCKIWSGWFSETLPAFLSANREPISFVHVDCDVYSSTREVLFGLVGRFSPGTVIAFDELLNYDTFLWNEMLALFEFLDLTGFGIEWIATHRNVRGADEAIELLTQNAYPRWEDDVAAGYHRQAAAVLTARSPVALPLNSQERRRMKILAAQFLELTRRRSSLNLG